MGACAPKAPPVSAIMVIVIMDYKELGMNQVGSISFAFAMNLMIFIQEALPSRLKEIHMVNNPMLFNMVLKFTKPLVKEKLNKRIHFHKSKMELFHKFILQAIFLQIMASNLRAISYGGKYWFPAEEGHSAYFQKLNRCRKN